VMVAQASGSGKFVGRSLGGDGSLWLLYSLPCRGARVQR